MREVNHRELRKPWLALLLIVPIPTISVLFSLEMAQGLAGGVVFVMSKAWMLALPILWHLRVESRERSWSLPERGGWAVGAGMGLAMSAVIVLTWLLVGRQNIDQQAMRDLFEPTGLTNPWLFGAVAIYWITANSMLEEIVFRWFIFERCEHYSSGNAAIAFAAAAFTIHHTIAMSFYFEPALVLLGTLGVFSAGAMWSWLYLRYRSIWIAYLSHAIVDVVVFGFAAYILLS